MIITIIIIHINTITFITRPHIFNNPVQFPPRLRRPAKKEVEQVFVNDQMMNGRVKVGEGGAGLMKHLLIVVGDECGVWRC